MSLSPHADPSAVIPSTASESRNSPERNSLLGQALRLISRLLKDHQIALPSAKLNSLYDLSDGHPFNFYRITADIRDKGIDLFLSNPSEFIEWKHRQSSEYVEKLQFSNTEGMILGLLKIVPELDFEAVLAALPIEAAVASEALNSLLNKHLVEASSDRFFVSPALRVAIERDRRIVLSEKLKQSAVQSLATTLAIRIDEGTAPIALIDTAVLSSIDNGGSLSSLAAAFLLPSHYVWLCKRHYDEGDYKESMRLAKEALKGINRLSAAGLVAAARYMCLSATRIGETETFNNGMAVLEKASNDDWARSNICFLKGFNARFKGNLPDAEERFREAYKLSPGNLSASRELASICLARGNLADAEAFAREAHSHATSNAYLLDILIAVLVKRYGKSSTKNAEIDGLFDSLEKVGEETGRSFFTTRKAELEHLWGNNKVALRHINEAIRKTPNIFEAQRLKAEILLKDGQKAGALEVIKIMKEKVNARDPGERRTNYRPYLETYSRYLQEVGQFEEAKEIFDDEVFTKAERTAAIKEIEIAQSFKSQRQ